jgi:hypothetical protein
MKTLRIAATGIVALMIASCGGGSGSQQQSTSTAEQTQEGTAADMMQESGVVRRVNEMYDDIIATYKGDWKKINDGRLENKYLAEETRQLWSKHTELEPSYIFPWFVDNNYDYESCREFAIKFVEVEELSIEPAAATVRLTVRPECSTKMTVGHLKLVVEDNQWKVDDIIEENDYKYIRNEKGRLEKDVEVLTKVKEMYGEYIEGYNKGKKYGEAERKFWSEELNGEFTTYETTVSQVETGWTWGVEGESIKQGLMHILVGPNEDKPSYYEIGVIVEGSKTSAENVVIMDKENGEYKIVDFAELEGVEGEWTTGERFSQYMRNEVSKVQYEAEAKEMWARLDERTDEDVSTARELVEALTRNINNIVIAEGAVINLTEILNDKEFFQEDGRYCNDEYIDPKDIDANVIWQGQSDGAELVINKLERLVIRGQGKGATILIDSRYARIFRFTNCQYVAIDNLTLGHTQGGYCEGEVLGLEDVTGFQILNCGLYGCGTCGVYMWNCTGVEVKNTAIYDCSEAIARIDNSVRTKFTKCDMYGNGREGSCMLYASGGEPVEMTDCHIFDNEANILFCLHAGAKLKDCKVQHDENNIGEIEGYEMKNCDMNASGLKKREDVGPHQHILIPWAKR